MRRTITICAAAVFLCVAGASGGETTRTPEEWVAQLGADHLADRDAASAALLDMGSKARDAVHAVLASQDAEVQWRAQELWKTLRWMVVPGADAADVRSLIEETEQKKDTSEHWHQFVKKNGEESIRLMAEFYAMKSPGYEKARAAILDDADPMKVAQVIAHAGSSKSLLVQSLEDLSPEKTAPNMVVSLMKIEIVLWNYQKAFDFGRVVWLHSGAEEVEAQCVLAMDRGKLFESVNEQALKDVASESDNSQLCKKLSFYIRIFSSTGNKGHVTALCDAAPNLDISHVNGFELQQLIEGYFKAGLPALVIKTLRHPRNPLELYMRSRAELQMQAADTAGADWNLVLEATKKASKADLFSLGELMRKWHDKRAGVIFEKILAITPPEPVYDANACFRLGEIAEEEHQFKHAADLMEKGMVLARGSGGILIATGGNKGETKSGEETIQELIKNLRARAAAEKAQPAPLPEASPEAAP